MNVQLSKGCPDETHILIVVQEVDNRPRPLESYTVPELVALTNEFTRQKRQIENSVVYITANITRGKMTCDTYLIRENWILYCYRL